MKTKVLIVDDSLTMRRVLAELIATAPDLEVVGAAEDANTARQLIKELNPDVLTLDVNMPGMSGLDFLERLMRLRPMPVVMVSAMTAAGGETTLRALELGAVDYIGKPGLNSAAAMQEYTEELIDKLRMASKVKALQRASHDSPAATAARPAPIGKKTERPAYTGGTIIVLGASTGGTEAIKAVLADMPDDCPPILIVQHMPETFTQSFARRLDSLCPPRVIESQGGEVIRAGTAYLAPGHSHLKLRRQGGNLVTELSSALPVNRHRPAVDVLFYSAAEIVAAKSLIGVILTGMGKDGALGLKAIHDAGAFTVAQDEKSCVVFGMPREAILVGAADEILPLEKIAAAVMNRVGARASNHFHEK